MRRSLLTAKAFGAIGSNNKLVLPNTKVSEGGFAPLTPIPFGSRIGIGPMTVGAVVVKAAAAKMIVTVKAWVKMVATDIFVANRT